MIGVLPSDAGKSREGGNASARGTLEYVAATSKDEILAVDGLGFASGTGNRETDWKLWAREMEIHRLAVAAKTGRQHKSECHHSILSWHAAELADITKARAIAGEHFRTMYGERRRGVIAIHKSKDGGRLQAHMVAEWADRDGKGLRDFRFLQRHMEETARSAIKHRLVVVAPAHIYSGRVRDAAIRKRWGKLREEIAGAKAAGFDVKEPKTPGRTAQRRRVSVAQHEEGTPARNMKRAPETTGMRWQRETAQHIDGAITAAKGNAGRFLEELQRAGVDIAFKENKGGIFGVSFGRDGVSAKGSAIGREYSAQSLAERITGAEADRAAVASLWARARSMSTELGAVDKFSVDLVRSFGGDVAAVQRQKELLAAKREKKSGAMHAAKKASARAKAGRER